MIAEQISTGVDWVTVTTPRHKTGFALYDVFRNYATKNYQQVGKIRGWGNRWYTGQAADHLKWGFSEINEGYILIASGDVAAEIWPKAVPHAKNVSRLDLQVTALLPTQNKRYIQDSFVGCVHQKRVGLLDKRRNYTCFVNDTGGATLYVGSRQSRLFGRLYDKGVETKKYLPGKLLRYEVELKGKSGTPMAKALLDQFLAQEMFENEVVKNVYHFFKDRGVTPLFRASGSPMVVELGGAVQTTTAEKKITWLRTQVRRSVIELLEMGYREEVSKALGVEVFEFGGRRDD